MLRTNAEFVITHASARQRLEERFGRLWARRFAGLAAADPAALYTELARRYSEPHRCYHTLAHIEHCLRQLDLAGRELNEPDAVETALWFHDVVYVPEAKDNELKSAELFLERLGQYLDPAFSRGVYAMILLTIHQETPRQPDGRFMVDIDLSGFGLPWEPFKQNSRLVRAEFSHLSDADFYPAHMAFLQALLDRPTVFFTDFFRSHYEATARENIRRSLEEWRLQGRGPR